MSRFSCHGCFYLMLLHIVTISHYKLTRPGFSVEDYGFPSKTSLLEHLTHYHSEVSKDGHFLPCQPCKRYSGKDWKRSNEA